jgi:hypothetical protein
MRQHQNRNQNQNQNQNKSRGRGRKPGNNANKTFDSNGPDVKIRGSASHIHEKYQTLARDANAAGDRVDAENYLQHAEHYFRLMATAQAAQAEKQAQQAQQAQQNQQNQQTRQKQNGNAEVAPNTQQGSPETPAPDEAKSDSNETPAPQTVAEIAAATQDASPEGGPSGEKAEAPKPARKRRPRRPKVEAEAPAAAEGPVSDDAPA